jgi:hypothetical protein
MPQATIEQAHAFIANLDLKSTITRSDVQTEEAEKAYRQFLLVVWSNKFGPLQGGAVAPSELADVVWHSHILHTQAYGAMCTALYGFFVHHHPNDGDTSEDERKLRRNHTHQVDLSIPKHLRFVDLVTVPAGGMSYCCSDGCECGD